MEKIIEAVRNYWNVRPCNIRHSVRPVATKEYFDEVEKRKYFVEPHIPAFVQFEKWKGKKVLEIGCGIGTDSINFARAGADLTVVDISDKSLEITKKRFEVYSLKAKFYCGNVEDLSSFLPIERYDLIYSFGVIHHTPSPKKAISEIKRFMNKETILKLMVYNRISWKAGWIVLKYGKGAFWRLDELVCHYSEAQIKCPVTYTYTINSVKKLFKEFEIEELYIRHIFPYKISDYVNYSYKKRWYFRAMPKRMFELLERRVGWHLCITAKLKE